jgi:cell fate regulator YaaT (PSP1 superfamily)
MPQTVEVRFKGTRRDFFLWPDDQEPLHLREAVVVDAERGRDFGRVHSAGAVAEKKCGGACTACSVGEGIQEGRAGGAVVDESALDSDAERAVVAEAAAEPPEAAPEPAPAPSPDRRSVLRRASQDDVRIANELRVSEEECRRQIIEKVRQHKLEMKVSDTEWQWDKSKLTVYFTAEKRVDFRALVRDLATIFRTRIELRQIGVRDEAARLKGVGRCGREYCCSTWLTELSPVSLALAKDQHLSLNPSQISGGCGRLLCCLKYEHEFYVAARKRFPREGKMLEAARGPEKVVAVDIFRERVFLRNEEGSRIIPLVQLREEMEQAAQLTVSGGPGEAAPAPAPERRGGPSTERPRTERPPRPERGPRTPLRDQVVSSPAARPPEKPTQPSERRDRPPRGQRPDSAPRERSREISRSPEPPAAGQPPAQAAPGAPSPGGEHRRRRRRGRRGGRGGGPQSPPPAPEG